MTAKFLISDKLMCVVGESYRTITKTSLQVSDAKILENDVPIFLITFATQEMLLFRNAKTGEISVGAEDKVEQCIYVAAVTRIAEELDNELTGGWKVVEVNCNLSVLCIQTDSFFCRWHGEVPEHTFKIIIPIYHFRLTYHTISTIACRLIASYHLIHHSSVVGITFSVDAMNNHYFYYEFFAVFKFLVCVRG